MHSFTLLSFAVLTAFGVDASPQPIERRAPAVIPGYDYAGCYTEATYTRALGGASGSDNKMTVNTCAAACAGSTYFGVEYGKECYCGNYLNAGSVAANPSDCSFPCPGDSSQSCGAGGRLSLYKRSTAAYTSKGCYTEATGKRALSDASFYSDSMTVSRCAAVCASYTFFGLEYGREVSSRLFGVSILCTVSD